MRKIICFAFYVFSFLTIGAQGWPEPLPEAKAGTRWWWLGSAVDQENLQWNLSEYARVGIGTVEITPLYGVQGNDQHNIPFLSPAWMKALGTVEEISQSKGIRVDMNNGTGWPFGGPEVLIEEAACKVLFVDTLVHGFPADLSKIDLSVPAKEKKYAKLQCVRSFPTEKENEWRVIAVYESRTRQKVKRAAPGGEGYVIDHFDRNAVKHYLERFDRAFEKSGVAWPHTFFNDSYEVYGANWTPRLFEEFKTRRGYALEDKLPELLGYVDDGNQVLADYRETLSDLLYENFTLQWVAWAHRHGVLIRNQAHGSPANLLDLYAAVDIPEIEGFGLSEFDIQGLRRDPGFTKKNYSDISMLKYAGSAAHVMGKRLTSSETFTWLTEHFRTSLSQMKPDLDLMFTCGINHVFFHGSCYTPKDDPWPGWKFYASIDMSPTNSIWRDAPELMKYIERCQSFLQLGQPDNDFLVYLPVRDMWHKRLTQGEEGLFMQFDIHAMDEKAPEFIRSILAIDSLGYDCDYISDRQLAELKVVDGQLVTAAGTRYKALIIPSGTKFLPDLSTLKAEGAPIIMGECEKDMSKYARAEMMRKQFKLRAIRRQNDNGYHYFIANLGSEDVDAWIPVTVPMQSAEWYHPLNGLITPASINGFKIHLSLRSGESVILKTSNESKVQTNVTNTIKSDIVKDLTDRSWTLSFMESVPVITKEWKLRHLQSWETLDDQTKILMGTGVYTTTVQLDKQEAQLQWQIELGDVRESARVYINDEYIGCAWAVPFRLDCMGKLRKGDNAIRIEVTNLPANRIAELDRQGIQWRKFNEINVVDLNYKKTGYGHWAPVPSGLNSTVRLVSK